MSTDVKNRVNSKNLTFHLTSTEPRAWLVLRSGASKPRVVEMKQQGANAWFARVDLIPGEYLCRYYCGDDRSVVYYGPAHIESGIDCGMDTLVSVNIPLSTSTVMLDHDCAEVFPISTNYPPPSSG